MSAAPTSLGHIYKVSSALAFAALLATALPAAGQQGQRIAGDFTAVTATEATLKPDAGDPVQIRLAPNLIVARLEKATSAALKPGVFVGVGARPQPDGSQKAVQIVIFPEEMRGVGEGHRAWGVMPEATMTNGAIAETVQSVDGPNFSLSYKGGEQKVTTPANASILALRLSTRAELKPGARGQVVATKQPDGSLSAARVTIWADGVTPY